MVIASRPEIMMIRKIIAIYSEEYRMLHFSHEQSRQKKAAVEYGVKNSAQARQQQINTTRRQ
jgi:hypothetical protein